MQNKLFIFSKKVKKGSLLFGNSNFLLYLRPPPPYRWGPLRRYVRTFVQTTIFLAQNYACAGTDDIFLLKTLYI